jgi:rRNA maturation RNase YbeY
MGKISFNNADANFRLKEKARLRSWIAKIISDKKKLTGDIAFIFCSDEYLINVNQQFLDHDTYTDIITFDYTQDHPKKAISGDIFISVDRIAENALKFKTDPAKELHRVMIHGVLHLLGYKDKGAAAKAEMTSQEDKSLKILSGI